MLSQKADECKPLACGGGGGGAGAVARGGGHAGGGRHQSMAVQVSPMNPVLKPPENTRLKLKHFETLSNFAFKINLRRYIQAVDDATTTVGRRCRLTLSNPR